MTLTLEVAINNFTYLSILDYWISFNIEDRFPTAQIHEKIDNKSWQLLVLITLFVAGLTQRCDHFVSERDFERDAQRVCQAHRSLKSLLAGTKRQALRQTSNEQCN